MKNYTKDALSKSLKTLLKSKPLDKITVKDIAEGAGVKRQTFYYHFQDIPELIEWICIQDVNNYKEQTKALTIKNWRDSYRIVFEVLLNDKNFVICLRHSLSRGKIEEYVYRMIYPVVLKIVGQKGLPSNISEKDRDFLIKFYMHSLIGVVLDWVDDDMEGDVENIIAKCGALLSGSLADYIRIVK